MATSGAQVLVNGQVVEDFTYTPPPRTQAAIDESDPTLSADDLAELARRYFVGNASDADPDPGRAATAAYLRGLAAAPTVDEPDDGTLVITNTAEEQVTLLLDTPSWQQIPGSDGSAQAGDAATALTTDLQDGVVMLSSQGVLSVLPRGDGVALLRTAGALLAAGQDPAAIAAQLAALVPDANLATDLTQNFAPGVDLLARLAAEPAPPSAATGADAVASAAAEQPPAASSLQYENLGDPVHHPSADTPASRIATIITTIPELTRVSTVDQGFVGAPELVRQALTKQHYLATVYNTNQLDSFTPAPQSGGVIASTNPNGPPLIDTFLGNGQKRTAGVLYIETHGMAGKLLLDRYSSAVSHIPAAGCSAVNLSPDSKSPQAPGAMITLTAQRVPSASGIKCQAAQFQFYVESPSGGRTLAQDWGDSKTFAWDTTGLESGVYHVYVYMRRSGELAPDAVANVPYVLARDAAEAAKLGSPPPAAPDEITRVSSGGWTWLAVSSQWIAEHWRDDDSVVFVLAAYSDSLYQGGFGLAEHVDHIRDIPRDPGPREYLGYTGGIRETVLPVPGVTGPQISQALGAGEAVQFFRLLAGLEDSGNSRAVSLAVKKVNDKQLKRHRRQNLQLQTVLSPAVANTNPGVNAVFTFPYPNPVAQGSITFDSWMDPDLPATAAVTVDPGGCVSISGQMWAGPSVTSFSAPFVRRVLFNYIATGPGTATFRISWLYAKSFNNDSGLDGDLVPSATQHQGPNEDNFDYDVICMPPPIKPVVCLVGPLCPPTGTPPPTSTPTPTPTPTRTPSLTSTPAPTPTPPPFVDPDS
ncbi:MAG: hypothetical protein ACYDCQ_16375 [Dehalococcoidia bacterium]